MGSEKIKVYCKDCKYYTSEMLMDYTYIEKCKYILTESPYMYTKKNYNPIPSIHNYNNDCQYYEECWINRILRRLKDE